MIERATAAREAGDWRGACAASNVAVRFDAGEVVRSYGRQVADQVADDLRHLAPDLVRWHLPRVLGGRSTLSTHHTFVLAAYGPTADDPHLAVRTPTMVDGPQRLRLMLGPLPGVNSRATRQWWTASRHLWRADQAGDLRERCGGGDRKPYFRRDGTPLTEAELPTGACPPDAAGRSEWLDMRFTNAGDDADALVAAFRAAGIALDLTMPRNDDWQLRNVLPEELLAKLPLALGRLGPELAHLVAHGGGPWTLPIRRQLQLRFDVSDSVVSAEVALQYTRTERKVEWHTAYPIPQSSWQHLPDLALVRAGLVSPDELHPLVRDALFPDRPTPAGPVGPPGPAAPTGVRVRCGREWHEVVPVNGRFAGSHTEEEERREDALLAFGGRTTGCFAVRRAWATRAGALPRGLRDQRRDLFHRVEHSDTPGVVALLDAGLDPTARDGRQRTLLHTLHKLDHEVLLPRLLAAGLDLEARDHHDRTPLHVAVGDQGAVSLVRTLLAAGAATDVADHVGWTLRDLIRRRRRTDLEFLYEALADRADEDGYTWLYEDDDLWEGYETWEEHAEE